MKRLQVTVPWKEGLHLRPVSRLVRLAQRFQSNLSAQLGGKTADLRSILSLMALCASLGMTLDIEVSGVDEEQAVQAVEELFNSNDSGITPTIEAGDLT